MSAFDKIRGALESHGMTVKGGNTKARAQCPVHGSNGLTLSLRRFDDHAGIHCFALCETADVLAAINLTMRDLFDEPGQTGSAYYVPPRRLTPWEEAMAGLGIHNPPPIEHVLRRMEVEAIKEGAVADE